MKQRSTTPVSKSFVAKASLVAAAVLMAVSGPVQMGSVARADQYDDKINAIQKQVSGYQQEAVRLQSEAKTLQGTISQLNAQKSAIQAQINLNQTKYDQLIAQITETEKKIKNNQDALGETLANLYVDEDISPLEMLASSSNISEYLDKQEYRNSIRDTLTQKITEIKQLKKDLDQQKLDVEKVLVEQRQSREELASKEAIQQKLLADTNNNEQAYQGLISSSQDQIKKYQQAQEELRNRQGIGSGSYVSVGGSGGYRWANAPYPCWDSNACADPWDLFYRECVSYVAWRLDNQGYGVRQFNGSGHAYQWPSTTSGYTSQTSGIPHKGDAAILAAGEGGAAWTGHVMYVEEVYGDGSIRVSEYNWSGRGTYSERMFSASEYSIMTFISFPRR
ncbi:MAG: CHAP domain-containing protein [Candidatus Saccharimonadales bacterium]